MSQAPGDFPPALIERLTKDSQQLRLAGYESRIEYQPEAVWLVCDLNTQEGMAYTVIWECAKTYPTTVPKVRVVQRGKDAFGNVHDNELQVMVPQLHHWNSNILLLELLRDEIEPRLERHDYTRIGASSGATLPASPVRRPPADPNQLLDLEPEPIRQSESMSIGMLFLWIVMTLFVLAVVALAVMIFVLGIDPRTLL